MEIGGKVYNGGERGLRVTTQWKLKEVSLCPIGADELATIRAEAKHHKRDMMDCPECGMQTPADGNYCASCGKEIKRAAWDTASPDPTITIKHQQPGEPTMEPTKEQLTDQEKAAVREAEYNRIREIGEWKTRFVGQIENVDQLATEAIKSGMSVSEFKGTLAEKMAEKGKALQTPQSALGLTEKEQKRYSILRAIRHLLYQRDKQFADMKVDASFEIECSNEIAARLGIAPKGILVPYEMQPGMTNAARAQRDATVGNASNAGALVGTTLMASEFIELRRNVYLADRIGVRVLSGLVGNVDFPKQTAAGTATWVGEQVAGAETNLTVGKVSLSLKTVSAFYDYSRKLLLQSTPSIDMLINQDLDQILRLAIDKAIFHGSGGDQPTGIENTSGVGNVVGAGLTWQKVIEFRTDVAVANSLSGSLSFVTDPVTFGTLMGRPKAAGYPVYLINDNGQMISYPVYDSNQITSGYLFFGDGSQVLLGEWGVLDILPDPYTASTKGDIRVVGFKSVDVALRHAGAWTLANDVS
jgi:HK97 family phage major capsid protein